MTPRGGGDGGGGGGGDGSRLPSEKRKGRERIKESPSFLSFLSFLFSLFAFDCEIKRGKTWEEKMKVKMRGMKTRGIVSWINVEKDGGRQQAVWVQVQVQVQVST